MACLLLYRPLRDGRLSWPWVAGWLHTVGYIPKYKAKKELTCIDSQVHLFESNMRHFPSHGPYLVLAVAVAA